MRQAGEKARHCQIRGNGSKGSQLATKCSELQELLKADSIFVQSGSFLILMAETADDAE